MHVPHATTRDADLAPVVRRMEALGPLTSDLKRRLIEFGPRSERVTPGAVLYYEREPQMRPRFILTGWAARQRILADGRRQIFSLLLPGDGVGVSLRPGAAAETTVVALTPMVVMDAGVLPGQGAQDACFDYGDAMQTAARLDESRLLDQILRLGRQTAYERTAHLILEVHERLDFIGRAQAGQFEWPISQDTLADILGLSAVHTNRTLQRLRQERLVALRAGRIQILDMARLSAIAEYRPAGSATADPYPCRR